MEFLATLWLSNSIDEQRQLIDRHLTEWSSQNTTINQSRSPSRAPNPPLSTMTRVRGFFSRPKKTSVTAVSDTHRQLQNSSPHSPVRPSDTSQTTRPALAPRVAASPFVLVGGLLETRGTGGNSIDDQSSLVGAPLGTLTVVMKPSRTGPSDIASRTTEIDFTGDQALRVAAFVLTLTFVGGSGVRPMMGTILRPFDDEHDTDRWLAVHDYFEGKYRQGVPSNSPLESVSFAFKTTVGDE